MKQPKPLWWSGVTKKRWSSPDGIQGCLGLETRQREVCVMTRVQRGIPGLRWPETQHNPLLQGPVSWEFFGNTFPKLMRLGTPKCVRFWKPQCKFSNLTLAKTCDQETIPQLRFPNLIPLWLSRELGLQFQDTRQEKKTPFSKTLTTASLPVLFSDEKLSRAENKNLFEEINQLLLW